MLSSDKPNSELVYGTRYENGVRGLKSIPLVSTAAVTSPLAMGDESQLN